MKILHAISSLDPKMGGPPAVAIALAAAQKAAGHEVTLLSATKPDRRAASLETFAATPGVGCIEQCWIDEPTSAGVAFFGGAAASVAEQVTRHEVVHLHGVWEPLLVHVANAARQLGVPYVVAPHGMLTAWCLTHKRWKKKIALAMGYRGMLRGAAFLHLLNRDEDRRTEVLRDLVPRRIVPNGMFLEEIDPLPELGGSAVFFPQLASRPYVLFLARLHPIKGLEFLAEAFVRIAKDLPNTQLVIAGPDYGAQRAFEQQTKKLGVAKRVHLLGPVYGDAKRSLLRDAACFCLPSRHETFSMSITEAMAFGVPAVITDTSHFPEVAEVGAGRVVPLSDVDALAAAMKSVLSDRALAHQMGEAGRRVVEERFTWGKIAERFAELYSELL